MSAQKDRYSPAPEDAAAATTAEQPGEQEPPQPQAMQQPNVPAQAANTQAPVVVPTPSSAREPIVLPNARPPAPAQSARGQVHVAPNLRELVTVPAVTPQETRAAKQQRDLNEIVHAVLIIGLVVSTALMLTGLALDIAYRREIPSAVPDIGEVFGRVIALRPSGFLALGLLVLIATPILRVVCSIGVFLYERDWRFAGITCLVLAVMTASLLLGKG